MKEVQISFEQISVEQKKYYQEIESTIIKAMQERFQIEYEEVQQTYTREKELKLKLETNICKKIFHIFFNRFFAFF